MLRRNLPPGFIVPAQPVEQHRPPAGPEWVHEIKHDGYRIIVRRDGDRVRLYSRKAIDWTARLPAIADGAARLRAKSVTLDGEAVVIGSDGLTDFEALRRRGAGDGARVTLPIGPMLDLGQGSESGEHRGAAGAQRELE